VAQSGKNTTSWLQCYQCDPTTHSSSACAKPLKNTQLIRDLRIIEQAYAAAVRFIHLLMQTTRIATATLVRTFRAYLVKFVSLQRVTRISSILTKSLALERIFNDPNRARVKNYLFVHSEEVTHRCLANTLNQPTNCSAPNNLTAPACFSEYLNYNNVSGNTVWNNFTGIHRGCIGANMTLVNYCSRNLAPNVTRLSCQTCNSSRCNTHTFSNNGGITGPGTGADGTSGGSGASNIIPFVSLIIFSFFVSHIKAGFRGSN
ncbi:hypothetical protein YQE_01919, partial [Dendroctonus ponderosae]